MLSTLVLHKWKRILITNSQINMVLDLLSSTSVSSVWFAEKRTSFIYCTGTKDCKRNSAFWKRSTFCTYLCCMAVPLKLSPIHSMGNTDIYNRLSNQTGVNALLKAKMSVPNYHEIFQSGLKLWTSRPNTIRTLSLQRLSNKSSEQWSLTRCLPPVLSTISHSSSSQRSKEGIGAVCCLVIVLCWTLPLYLHLS